jgi:hypothetical protein
MKVQNIGSDSFGDTILGIVVAVLLASVLTHGEPDVIDAIRKMILDYAGLAG